MQSLRTFNKRLFSTCLKSLNIEKAPIAFVFDIDGVLMQTKNPILPFAPMTLTYLKDNKIPFILLTNGGGMKESSRIKFLNDKLTNNLSNADIGDDNNDSIKLLKTSQLVQSHTPMKNLIKKYNRVLVIGGLDPEAREVALNYGFNEVIRPIDIIKSTPNIWPFSRYTQHELIYHSLNPSISLINEKPIDAILVFNDPRDMGTDLQIIIDLLCSKNGLLGTRRIEKSSKPSIPIIWSNKDLLWSTGYPIPRFGQGAFRLSVRELYKSLNNGFELNDTVLGKPFSVSFKYAEWILGKEWKNLSNLNNESELNIEKFIPDLNVKPTENLFKKVYMVGDNPESDIKGGNDYGWETILVKTGVYKDGDFEINKNLSKPTFGIFNNVWDGVSAALKANGYKL
ncbi:hypothetical protein C6P40_001234 [Pichia californica]|uniref:TIGR01456 family HAD hydrolase n=1 Tax=Pichia californica TaxID=460514 RepID=A0A9P7BHQ7_9ASCO|nr:hypothetical protein C6P40_001234 [[Candida] californica]